MRLLILRPEPGSTATAKRAQAMGFEVLVAPLFAVRPCAWTLPETALDAVMLTSANAARALAPLDPRLAALPAYAVGAKTGAAATAAGFADVRAGAAGVAELVARAAADGVRRLLHLAGADRTAFDPAGVEIVARTVYASETVEPPPALPAGDAVALLHSARAARRFAELVAPARFAVACLSPAVAAAAGPGWRALATAAQPDDDALLAVAARLCQEVRA